MTDNLAVYTVCVGDGFALPDIYPSDGVEYLCFRAPLFLTDFATIKQVVQPVARWDGLAAGFLRQV